jgi:hypothetical protein
MDAICKAHDLCYGPNPSKEQKLTCDKTMVDGLKKLPKNPAEWENPPNEAAIKDSNGYRRAATALFE